MINHNKIYDQVVKGIDFSDYEYTQIRKTLLNEDFVLFEKILSLSIGNSPSASIARKIVFFSPRYISNPESILKFKKYIDYFIAHPKDQLSATINQMSTAILNNKNIPPSYKFVFYKYGYPSDVITSRLSNDEIDAIVLEFSKEMTVSFVTKLPYGFTFLLFEALSRNNLKCGKELSYCLQIRMEDLRSKPDERYINEELMKKIIKSSLINDLENDLFKECLSCWKQLENDTALKFQQNNHHQTKKRLVRLQEGYLLMKDLFRSSLEQRSDILSKLDSMLMG